MARPDAERAYGAGCSVRHSAVGGTAVFPGLAHNTRELSARGSGGPRAVPPTPPSCQSGFMGAHRALQDNPEKPPCLEALRHIHKDTC